MVAGRDDIKPFIPSDANDDDANDVNDDNDDEEANKTLDGLACGGTLAQGYMVLIMLMIMLIRMIVLCYIIF